MLKKLFSLLLCAVLLSGCMPNFTTDSLLSPPKLTPDQSKLFSALEAAVGSNNFKLKYPRRGEYLSAFILEDIDDDNIPEAIAFYELTVAGATSTWMSILVQDAEGEWRSAVQVPGPHSEVDFIRFAPITQLERKNIIVGWSASKREDMQASVYLFTGNQVATMFTEVYDELLTTDVDRNGLHELLLFTKNYIKPAAIRLAKFSASRVSIVSEVNLPTSTIGFENVGYGALATGLNGVFADVNLDNGLITTIIATVDRSTLTELFAEDFGLHTSFERRPPSLSISDVNNDGYLDLPQNELLPGYGSQSDLDKLYLSKFYSIVEGSLVPTTYAIVNHKAGYMLKVPPAWEGTVTVLPQADTNEWRFVIYGGSLAQSELELLKIKAVSPGDYVDKFDTTEYRTIATRGSTTYLAYIPDESYDQLSISYEDLEQLFRLL